MCMIIYKPAGVCPPSFKLLEEFTCRNPHGFGSAVFDGGSPSLLKTLDSSLFLNELCQAPCDPAWLLHFRYATAGSKSRSNCHPWLLEDSPYVFAHNGTVPKFSWDNGLTDSENFLRHFVTPRWLFSRSLQSVGKGVSPFARSSRFILTSGKETLLAGDWFLHRDGWFCSKPSQSYNRREFSSPVFPSSGRYKVMSL